MAGQKTPTALGTENIGKLLMQYAVPAIIAMTASSLYNMVIVFSSATAWVRWLFRGWR